MSADLSVKIGSSERDFYTPLRVDLRGALGPDASVQPGKREDSERQQGGGYCMANSCGEVTLIKEAESSGISEEQGADHRRQCAECTSSSEMLCCSVHAEA